METETKKKGGSTFAIILIIIALCLCGAGGYLTYKDMTTKKEANTPNETTEEEETTTEEVTDSKLTDEEALKIGNELWEYARTTYWGGEPAWPTHEGEKNEAGGIPVECDTTKEEVLKKYASDFKYKYLAQGSTEDVMEDTIDNFVPADCGSAGARGSLSTYEKTELSIGTIEEDKITFKAASTYSNGLITEDFIIVKDNDNWLIQQFFLPN